MNFKDICIKLSKMGVSVHFDNHGYTLIRNEKEIHCKTQNEVMLLSNRLHHMHINDPHFDNFAETTIIDIK